MCRYAQQLRASLAEADPEDKLNARNRRRAKRLLQKQRLKKEMVPSRNFFFCSFALGNCNVQLEMQQRQHGDAAVMIASDGEGEGEDEDMGRKHQEMSSSGEEEEEESDDGNDIEDLEAAAKAVLRRR